MSEAQADLLAGIRVRLREWRRSLAMIADGQMRLHTNNVDTTEQHVTMVKRMIADNEALLRHYDPENATVDSNIEFGGLSRGVSREIWAGRWVTYKLDAEGQAVDVRAFNDEVAARLNAQNDDREIGQVAEDHWSIVME